MPPRSLRRGDRHNRKTAERKSPSANRCAHLRGGGRGKPRGIAQMSERRAGIARSSQKSGKRKIQRQPQGVHRRSARNAMCVRDVIKLQRKRGKLNSVRRRPLEFEFFGAASRSERRARGAYSVKIRAFLLSWPPRLLHARQRHVKGERSVARQFHRSPSTRGNAVKNEGASARPLASEGGAAG